MATRPAPRDFRITLAGDDFLWGGARYPGFPILRWPDGAICEPVVTYFGHCAERGLLATSSMKPAVYAIREWLAHLARCGERWETADDALLEGWRDAQSDAVDRGVLGAQQVERKISVVFGLYKALPDVLPLDARGRRRAPFVGAIGSGCPVTSKTIKVRKGGEREVWSGLQGNFLPSPMPHTPHERTVLGVLDWLRSVAERNADRCEEPDVRNQLILLGERNWMIGRSMAEGGLRAAEAAGLTVDLLGRTIRDEAASLGLKDLARSLAGRLALDRIDGQFRSSVLAVLDRLEEDRGRKNVYPKIVGKGRKARRAAFPIELMRDLLQVAVWRVRRAQLEASDPATPERAAHGAVFLSHKTGAGLRPGSVSDLIKEAFDALKTGGSAHRLRAFYATEMAFRLWDELFREGGFRFDQTLVNVALEQLRQAMGHADVDMTVRHYLDLALARHFGPRGSKRRQVLQRIWDALARGDHSLTDMKVSLLVRTLERLLSPAGGSKFQSSLSAILEETSSDVAS